MHINFGEILVILLVILLVIKPENLPNIACKFGKLLNWFKNIGAKL